MGGDMATISAAAFGVKCGLVRAARVRFCGPFFESDGDEPALIFPILAASHICAGAGCAGHDLVGQPVELVDAAAWAPEIVTVAPGSIHALLVESIRS